jgi:hypothetical protein
MNQLYLDLCKVKALLVAGWGQGEAIQEPGKTCLFRACERVNPNNKPLKTAIYDELARLGWLDGMVDWNDHAARTKAEVIGLVQRAANRVE